MTYTDKRIAFFAQGLAGGGAERAIINLMHEFLGRGIAVDLLLTKRTGEYLELVPPEVSITNFDTDTPRAGLRKLIEYLKTERPSALIAAFPNSNVVALMARRISRVPTRVGISIQNTISQELSVERGRRRKVLRLFTKMTYPWADLIACVSAGVADDLAKVTGIPRTKIDVIYNPVVTDNLFERAKEPVDHPWLAPGQPPVILSVGRLAPQKDQTVMIEAFAKLRAQRPCRLLILGQGVEREKLEAKVAELGVGDDVSLPGFASNPYAYMARAAVFTLSSRFEGLPTVLIEALACGTQVVSTDCPSGPYEILADGKYGWLVPMGDPDALAKALGEALDHGKPPVPESWHPYRAKVSADKFCEALL